MEIKWTKGGLVGPNYWFVTPSGKCGHLYFENHDEDEKLLEYLRKFDEHKED